jgi:hypothetical protein
VVSARRLARTLGRLVALVLIVVGARQLIGPLLSSVLLTVAGLWFGVRAWARWESGWGTTAREVLVPDAIYRQPSAASSERHAVFARTLAAVAAAYADECEQEASQP